MLWGILENPIHFINTYFFAAKASYRTSHPDQDVTTWYSALGRVTGERHHGSLWCSNMNKKWQTIFSCITQFKCCLQKRYHPQCRMLQWYNSTAFAIYIVIHGVSQANMRRNEWHLNTIKIRRHKILIEYPRPLAEPNPNLCTESSILGCTKKLFFIMNHLLTVTR